MVSLVVRPLFSFGSSEIGAKLLEVVKLLSCYYYTVFSFFVGIVQLSYISKNSSVNSWSLIISFFFSLSVK